MKFEPLNDRVQVALEDPKSAGGLYVPNPSKAGFSHLEGEVLAISSDVTKVKVGERVLYHPNSGIKDTILGRAVVLLKSEELLGVYRDG